MRFLAYIFVAVQAFACITVDRDRILASDLAAANPAFAPLDPKLEIAPSPIPAVTRVFRSTDLARIARAHNIELAEPAEEICFERATERLTIEKLLPVLRDALSLESAQIEILDFSRTGVPHGTLAFAKSGLSATGMWHGRVLYDQSKSAPIWAKVRVTVERTWIEAASEIPSGKLIDASQLTIRKGPRFPFNPMPLESLDLATDRKALRTIHAGDPIFASMLLAPREIEIGDTVHVNVSSGGALLEFDAVAQSSAHAGESVLLKNPENNRLFQARVDAKGKASVIK